MNDRMNATNPSDFLLRVSDLHTSYEEYDNEQDIPITINVGSTSLDRKSVV